MAAPSGEQILDDIAENDASPSDLTSAQVREIRKLLDSSLWHFLPLVCGFRDLYYPLHGPLCQLLERWGEPGYRRLMVQLPRGTFKSSVGVIGNVLWRRLRDPDQSIAIFNITEHLPERWIRAMKEIISRNPWVRVLWPEVLPPRVAAGEQPPKGWKWSDSEINLQRGVYGMAEATITALGYTASATGGHWHEVIKDDIINERHARSPAEMEDAFRWLSESSFHLERPSSQGIDLINCTPWAFRDAYYRLLEKFPYEASTGTGYRLYRRSALEHGESSFPPRWTKDQLIASYKSSPFDFMCLPGDSKILMADWSYKNFADVKVGDKVVGYTLGTARRQSVLTPADVVRIETKTAEVFEYVLEDGSKVRCTEDHQWYAGGKQSDGRPSYLPLLDLRVGRGTKSLYRVSHLAFDDELQTPEELRAASWLGGIFDGEGTVTGGYRTRRTEGYGGCIIIVQGNGRNKVVCDEISRCLFMLGFRFNKAVQKQTSDGLGEVLSFTLLGGRQGRHRFMRLCRPVRAARIVRSLYGARWATRVRVVSRRNLGKLLVYGMETSTGNYVADGFASKNSQQMCLPRAARDVSFDIGWIRYGSIGLSRGNPAFVIDRGAYDPKVNEAPDGDEPPREVPLVWMDKGLFFDPAPTEGTDRRREPASRNGLAMEGIDPWGRRFILETRGETGNLLEVVHRVLEMLEKWGAYKVYIEDVSFTKWAKAVVAREAGLRGQFVQCIPCPPGRTDKDTRIQARFPAHQSGLYYWNRGAVDLLVQEAMQYAPGQGSAPKDILDALGYDSMLTRPESPLELERAYYNEQMRRVGADGRDSVLNY